MGQPAVGTTNQQQYIEDGAHHAADDPEEEVAVVAVDLGIVVELVVEIPVVYELVDARDEDYDGRAKSDDGGRGDGLPDDLCITLHLLFVI